MKITSRSWSQRCAIISIGVVACLCFSIGEGLRLTPFPVSPVSEIEAFEDSNDALRRYGPLNVPTRTQSRNKRQVVDFAYAAPERAFKPPLVIGCEYHETLNFSSLPPGPPQIGRAPPFAL